MNKFLLMLLVPLALTGRAQHVLSVTIMNVVAEKGGTVKVAIYCTSDSFLKSPVATREASVNGGEVTLIFENLKAGNYAISTFQDSNKNNKLDTNFFGIPSEPYGFSNDVMGNFGPPSFEKASFEVNRHTSTIIHLR